MRLTWKKHKEKWQPDSYHLRIDGFRVATVAKSRSPAGIYWYARSDEHGIEMKNTAGQNNFASFEEAKADCRAYVEECLKKAKVGK